MKKKIFLCIASVILIIGCMCASVMAFDANDYDYNFDIGGSSGGSSGDSSFFFFGDIGGGGGFSIGSVVALVVIIAIVIIVNKNKSKGGGVRNGMGAQGINVVLPDRSAEIEQIIKQFDPDFSGSDFITFSKNVFMDIEDAWCKRDLAPVRPVMHQNLYNTTEKQVQSKIQQGVVYHYESIAIDTAYLTSFVKDSQFEYLTTYLSARMIDYQVDEKTGNIIRGDKTTRWVMRYKMKFVRSAGVKTKQETGEMNGHNCPNCGAPLEMSSSGICEYCGSTVTTGEYSWVLTEFTAIRNDTTDDGIRVPKDNN